MRAKAKRNRHRFDHSVSAVIVITLALLACVAQPFFRGKKTLKREMIFRGSKLAYVDVAESGAHRQWYTRAGQGNNEHFSLLRPAPLPKLSLPREMDIKVLQPEIGSPEKDLENHNLRDFESHLPRTFSQAPTGLKIETFSGFSFVPPTNSPAQVPSGTGRLEFHIVTDDAGRVAALVEESAAKNDWAREWRMAILRGSGEARTNGIIVVEY